MTTRTTYRIERLDRDGAITQTIDHLQQKPITREMADAYLDLARIVMADEHAAGDMQWRVVENITVTDKLERWKRGNFKPVSGRDLAEILTALADEVREVGVLPGVIFNVEFHVSNFPEDAAANRAGVDEIAAAIGLVATQEAHYGTQHVNGGVKVVTCSKAPEPPAAVFDEPPVNLIPTVKAADGCVPRFDGLNQWEIGSESCIYAYASTPERVVARHDEDNRERARMAAHGFPAGLPDEPYTTVRVVEQRPGRGMTSVVPVGLEEGEPLWTAYGLGGDAPTWLMDVPVGKTVVVKIAFIAGDESDPDDEGGFEFFNWVQPADDWCTPRTRVEGEWEIGDDTCASLSWGHDSPEVAVDRHNSWLASVLDRPAEPAVVPAAPAAISDERVEEIRQEANSRYHGDTPNEDGAWIRTLPELDRLSIPPRAFGDNAFTSFRLVDGTQFVWSRPLLEWEVTR